MPHPTTGRLALRAAAVADDDGTLLGRFLAARDEAAFAELVRRHGPMVLGVCRRVLGHREDAEDAFQAAFLVLVRRADGLAGRAVIGDWLHGVALRVALRARARLATARRSGRAAARPESVQPNEPDPRLAALDAAIAALPEKYRRPVVLCDLDGRTRAEAARLLGWPEGTVAGRLARARALLARRLGGVVPEVAAALVLPAVAAAAVRAALLDAAGRAGGAVPPDVLALAEGTVRAMTLTKLRTLAAAVALGAASVGLAYAALPADPPAPRPAAANELPAPPAVAGLEVAPPPRAVVPRPGLFAADPPAPAWTQKVPGVGAAAFAPDGRTLATGAGAARTGGRVRLWDAATGRAVGGFDTPHPPVALAFSPAGDRLTVRTQVPYGPGELTLFTAAGRPLWGTGLGDRVRGTAQGGCAVSPDGRVAYVAVPPNGGGTVVLAAAGGEVLRELPDAGEVHALAFAPDGKTLALGTTLGEVWLWDVIGGAVTRSFRPNGRDGGYVSGLAYTPDGAVLLVGQGYRTVRVCDPATGAVTRAFDTSVRHESLAVWPDGRTLAAGPDVFDLTTGPRLLTLPGWEKADRAAVAVSRDGRRLAAGADGVVAVWETPGGGRH
jgi:RNA polymerase sigma factor (sigma-70 family)